MMKMFQPTTNQVTTSLRQFFRRTVDQDNNGIITYPEFTELALNNLKLTTEEVDIWKKFKEICGDADIINEASFVNFFKTVHYKFKELVDSEAITSVGGMFGFFR
jgi:hypothetical protein